MKPAADFSGDLLLDGGNYDQVHMAANQNLRASDQLSFRVSADYNRHDGYQSHGLDASNRIEGRVSALFTPGSDLTALLFVSGRSEEHTSELQSLMRISYAVFCLKKKTKHI